MAHPSRLASLAPQDDEYRFSCGLLYVRLAPIATKLCVAAESRCANMRHGVLELNSSAAVEVARKPDVGHSAYMYPFPPSDDLRFLVGETIGQIALDPWSLQFRFADGGQITVEGRIEHVDAGGLTHSHDCQKRTGEALYLHQLLQHLITAVETEPHCLSLRFASGAILRIFTELGGYECGQINFLGRSHDYIVF